MAVEIKLPELGESIVEATIGAWRKGVGDAVAAGEPVVDIETDKIVMEVAAPAAGVLSAVAKKEGDVASVGEVLGLIEAGAAPAAPAAAAAPAPAVPAGAPSLPVPPLPAPVAASPAPAPADVAASPTVRRLAREYGVDLAQVPASGPGGRVSATDVEAFARGQGQAAAGAGAPASAPSIAPAAVAAAPDEEIVHLSRRKQTMARQLVAAQQTAAMLTTFNEVDMSAVMALRAQKRDAVQERFGVRLGFMSAFLSAVVGALKQFPTLNAEMRGDDLVLKRHYDIGVAVAAAEGLVVPVLRGADRLNLVEIERHVADLARRAREGKLSLEDIRGGTFTITNGGVFGSLLSTPILNAPQVGILGMHGIQERPVARGGQVVIRPMMYIALSYDHRVVEGAEAVQFLVTVKRLVEEPVSLLVEG